MLDFVNDDAHLEAMKRFKEMADTIKSKVVRWQADEFPNWVEAIKRNDDCDYDYTKSYAYKLVE